ncbi:SprT-like family-domain-containing protein [Clohesyomyces aquaticus]|uniref:Protein with SprT-like domain at the N terminus n=1 Tax=Clohesyomyces aquaticus TaxID=1231657 RepID=A0A1Y1ZTY6_9PLEO|nr:SprT-like family-domain-containing protein [Clohesyomyces aquaticus]
MPVTDEEAALQAIAALDSLSPEQQSVLESINAILHNDEPFVDIHELFGLYNVLYFRSLLVPRVEVSWSPRLTLCAGICELTRDPTTKKYTRIRLKLSTPLLQFRPRSDTINTLLHESIHAYFFLTSSFSHTRSSPSSDDEDASGHGPGFQLLASFINTHSSNTYSITIYHTFHDEVDHYRTHVWKCSGPCKEKAPYYGLVKRSMNRAPGKSDTWWARHEAECGGTWMKVGEPGLTRKQKEGMSARERAGRQRNKIDGWVVRGRESGQTLVREGPDKGGRVSVQNNAGGKRRAEAIVVAGGVASSPSNHTGSGAVRKRQKVSGEDKDEEVQVVGENLHVECPICSIRVPDSSINEHLDVVHPP